jgi:asparagine synthase (glutamine-hydrolysing)
MCGIGGAINYQRSNISVEALQAMGSAIEHRGPNDFGYFSFTRDKQVLSRNLNKGSEFNVAFMHRRLSILDLSERGWQPMQTIDKRYTICYNGEVYNYVELREKLLQKGYTFQTETDTEVILYAYQEWGVACLPLLNGMFAFTIHDALKNELLFARDPFGIKPLYYIHNEKFLLFCSEIKGLLTEPKIKRDLNSDRLNEYLQFGWVNQNPETIFRDIKEIPAAHYAIVSTDAFSPLVPIPYWSLKQEERKDISFVDAVDQVKSILYNNIKIHLRSDVEVGYTLSGGIDSSSIVCVANDILPQKQKISFSYLPNYEGKSERKWIDIVNRKVNARPYYIQPSEETFTAEIENIIALQDEPFGGTSIYAQYKVFELVGRNDIKVVLDGQGADEIFAGYTSYFTERAFSILQKHGFIKYLGFLKSIDPALNISKSKELLRTLYKYLPHKFQTEVEKLYFSHSGRVLNKELLNLSPSNFSNSPYQEEFLKGSLHKSLKFSALPAMLRYQDRNAMAFSVEGRVPFLTKDLVEYVYSLPEEYILVGEGYTKKLLREAMKEFLPNEITERKDKIGFETPEQSWIKNSSGWTHEVLHSVQEVPGLNIQMLRKEFDDINNGKRPYTVAHWRYLNYVKWASINKVS